MCLQHAPYHNIPNHTRHVACPITPARTVHTSACPTAHPATGYFTRTGSSAQPNLNHRNTKTTRETAITGLHFCSIAFHFSIPASYSGSKGGQQGWGQP